MVNCAIRSDSLTFNGIPQSTTDGVHQFRAQNNSTELATGGSESWDHLSLWDFGISVGFFMETSGSLRNPKIWCTPSTEDNK